MRTSRRCGWRRIWKFEQRTLQNKVLHLRSLHQKGRPPMSDTTQTLRDDIAFVRALAEEGRQSPYRGGISLAAGVIWGSASLYTWSVASQLWHPPGGMSTIGWSWA